MDTKANFGVCVSGQSKVRKFTRPISREEERTEEKRSEQIEDRRVFVCSVGQSVSSHKQVCIGQDYLLPIKLVSQRNERADRTSERTLRATDGRTEREGEIKSVWLLLLL